MIGKADKKQKEIYNTVLNAQMTGLNVLKAGIGGFSADKSRKRCYRRSRIWRLFWTFSRTRGGTSNPELQIYHQSLILY